MSTPCNGLGCYPDRCGPGECVLQNQATAQSNSAEPIGMFDQERDRPWLYAGLYGAAIVLSLLASHFAARGA